MSTVNPNMHFPPEVIVHIGSFLEMSRREIVQFTRLDKAIKEKGDQLLKSQYQRDFGKINSTYKTNPESFRRILLAAGKDPNANVNHSIYEVPSNLLERWKWIVGVENSLDKKVQENYDSNIDLLENTQATSIIRLKNQLEGFWHTDRQVKDYRQFKSAEQARATSGRMNKIFFACLKFLFKLCYNPSVLKIGKKLDDRSQETFAKIGKFNLNNKDYDVVAFHRLVDENTADPYKTNKDKNPNFKSQTSGRTYIGIIESNKPHSMKELFSHNQNFGVLIGRKDPGAPTWDNISCEDSIGHGTHAVSNSERYLITTGSSIQYFDSTTDVQGSDRLLDQKITQIMVEMTMQNKDIISLKVASHHDDLPVLMAGGFKSSRRKKIIEELTEFRANEGNKLFPPYKDYSSVSTSFETKDFTKKNVFYSREGSEAWSDIIQRAPILKPSASILPEYWVTKPKLIEEATTA